MSNDISPILYELVKNTVLHKIPVRDGGAQYKILQEFIMKTNGYNSIVFNSTIKPTRDDLIAFIDTNGLIKQNISTPSSKSITSSNKPLTLPPPKTTLTSTDVLKDSKKIILPKLQDVKPTLPSVQLTRRPIIIKPLKNVIKSINGINEYIKFLYEGKYTFSNKECGGGGDCFYHVIRHVLTTNKSILNDINENYINYYKIKDTDKKSQIQFLRELTCSHVDSMNISELYLYVSNNREPQMAKHKKEIMNNLISVMKNVLNLYKIPFIELTVSSQKLNDNDNIHMNYINIERDFKDNDMSLKKQRIILETVDKVFISKELVKETLRSNMYANHFDISIIAEMLQLKLVIFPSDAKIIVIENVDKTQSKEIVQETCINGENGIITIIIFNISLSHFQLGILTDKETDENIYMFETGTRPEIEQILCRNKVF